MTEAKGRKSPCFIEEQTGNTTITRMNSNITANPQNIFIYFIHLIFYVQLFINANTAANSIKKTTTASTDIPPELYALAIDP